MVIWSEEDEIREQSRVLHGRGEEDFGDNEAHVLYLIGFCGQWSGSAMHYDHDEADKEKAKEQIQDKHHEAHPDCQRTLTFGYI